MKICAKIVGEKSMQSRTEVNFPAGFIAERLGVGVTDLFPKNKDKNEKKKGTLS